MPFKALRLVAVSVLIATVLAMVPILSSGQTATPLRPDRAETLRRVKQIQVKLMLQRAQARLARGKVQARLARHSRKTGTAKPLAGAAVGQRRTEIPEVGFGRPARPFASSPTLGNALNALGPNLLVNDTTGDRFSAAGQAEPAIAAWGNYVLVAWNDGQGFENGPDSDLMGYGYSTDGGVTFHDGGDIPRPTANARWSSDPVLAVNEKTGEFYFVGLIEPTASSNGLAIARATFSGTSISWSASHIIRSVSNTTDFIDKPWVAADSSSGRLYVSYTRFFSTADVIEFQRSTTAWNVWGPAVPMNTAGSNGLVQGSRPAVGPAGEVYVIWKEIGLIDADFFRIRKSTNQGSSFGTAATAATLYDNFGTGAPGFNRERGITFPAIAVDRSHGPDNGRVYVAWNECINWYRDIDVLGSGGVRNEAEQNSGPNSATAFTPGEKLVGSFSNVGDIDFWKFNPTQGTTYTFWCDSIPNSLYSMRVICSDDTTRLNLSGDLDPPADNQNGFIVWTCPSAGEYYVRMFSNIPGNLSGSYYRILTGANSVGPEPGRDQRDVMVVSAIDGQSFGAPTRPNTDPAYFDNWLPEITVSGDGRLFAFWYGWHEASPTTCGGESNLYVARSDDAGQSWRDVGRVTDETTPWSRTFSNIQPNQGDYLALFANDVTLYHAWTDGRLGNPDIYALVLPLSSTPTLVSLLNADAQPNRITVSWYAASEQVSEAYVYRLEGADWDLKGVIQRDGLHRLTYIDNDVSPGVRYTYRLGVRDGSIERYLGQVSVIAPSLQKLRIESVRPNPTVREVWVSFTLPRLSGAQLSLVDITGRRVRQREVGSLGEGKHLLNLAEGSLLPAGVYVVRLEQGGRVQTARVSVIR